METLATVFSWLVVALHLLFGYMESAGWSQMARRFGYDKAQTETTRTLALNQGMYNVGLAVVLGWSLVAGHGPTTVAMLSYVVAMGLVGAATASRLIIVLQALPAGIALALQLL